MGRNLASRHISSQVSQWTCLTNKDKLATLMVVQMTG